MTGSVVLDIVIGITFVYLLYSLLGTLVAEIIATNLGLRARNLHSAIKRMLMDSEVTTLKSFGKSRKGALIDSFYNHPEVKFMSPNKFFSKPSAIKDDTFSKTLVFLIKERGEGDETTNIIKTGIKNLGMDSSTQKYVESLFEDANHDIDKFKSELERWYNNTMKQATEWYKRNLQIMLFIIGLVIATLFNVDTFKIVEQLSNDKEARAQMVELASTYINNNPITISTSTTFQDSLSQEAYNDRIDSLLEIKKTLDVEIEKTQNILGGGSWLPDSLTLTKNGKSTVPLYINASILPAKEIKRKGKVRYANYSFLDKLKYLLKMFVTNFFGYAVTALAISLGAPFWFDLLNKFMKLRGTLSEKTNEKK
ncbi:hypothetical protein E1176_16610 [Fulvivirga sp. RKSG066]|uniref:hypothetical protein n=1 Tax=Fulvivirga aurantia TaxID=2529383 RepID=UPI0012BB9673|nr:hypothetical protein [Fulvivirga aurantia]MTI22656.1 hypothetical protein [Fulvivirga aurantia]